MRELLSFILSDLALFLGRLIFDLSVIVSAGPLIFSLFQDHIISSSVKNEHDDVLTLHTMSQPFVSLSLHVMAFITAGLIFIAQNAPVALNAIGARNDAVRMSAPLLEWTYIIAVIVVVFAWGYVVSQGCAVNSDDVRAYVAKGSSKKPPDIALTKYRLWLVVASFLVNPFYQFVSFKLG